jgi:hypothetical protein
MTTLPDNLTGLTSLTYDDLVVAKTVATSDAEVSTMLLPLGLHAGQFETMVLGDASEWDGWYVRYPTREKAEAGHAAIVKALAEGRDLDMAVAK